MNIDFAKDHRKDSLYKYIYMENFEIKKKNSNVVQNFRTLKVFDHIQMGYNLHDVLRKVVAYYKIKHNIIKKKFGYDLKLLSFEKTKH